MYYIIMIMAIYWKYIATTIIIYYIQYHLHEDLQNDPYKCTIDELYIDARLEMSTMFTSFPTPFYQIWWMF